jgi:hypothetical protein
VKALERLSIGRSLIELPALLVDEPQIVVTVQVEPKLRASAEEMSESQTNVTSNRHAGHSKWW